MGVTQHPAAASAADLRRSVVVYLPFMHIWLNTLGANQLWAEHYAVHLQRALQQTHPQITTTIIGQRQHKIADGWRVPLWAWGRVAPQLWLRRRARKHAPSAVVHVGSTRLCPLPCAQVLLLFEQPAPKMVARAKRYNAPLLAVWPQLAASGQGFALAGHGGWPLYFPLDWHQKEETLATHTDGCPYFFIDAAFVSTPLMVQVLKAFSMFKKRQQTVMKLVVANGSPKLEALLRSYKYRHDVVTDKPRSLRPQLIASAYAVICVGPWLQSNVGLLQAIQAQKALICFPKADFEPLAGTASRYPDSMEPSVLATVLMQLYTNEPALLALEQEAAAIAKAYTWQNVADAVLAALPPLV